ALPVGEHRELHDRPAALRRFRGHLELRLVAPPAQDAPHRIGRDAAPRAPVAADDQPPIRRDHPPEEPLDQLTPPLLRHVDELRPHEVEPSRRLPLQRVADDEAIRPPRQPRAGQLDEARREVEPVRLERMRRPADERLEQVPVRAADVEEAAGPVDRLDDRSPRRLPPLLVAAEAALAAWIVAREVVLLVDLDRVPAQNASATRSRRPPRSAMTSNETSTSSSSGWRASHASAARRRRRCFSGPTISTGSTKVASALALTSTKTSPCPRRR